MIFGLGSKSKVKTKSESDDGLEKVYRNVDAVCLM